jgi:hypothetical protein
MKALKFPSKAVSNRTARNKPIALKFPSKDVSNTTMKNQPIAMVKLAATETKDVTEAATVFIVGSTNDKRVVKESEK